MLKKYIVIFLINFFVLTFSQTINIEGKLLNIGMEKSILQNAEQSVKEFD